jgi:hypothetical protein
MRASASTFAALAFAVGACASDTGIVIEVSWTEADFPAAETLRIYVATGDPTRAAVDEASVAEPVEMITLPYRYLLRPDGALGDIGPLVLAAGLTAGEPPQPLAFDVYPEAVAFADGEIRTVRLTPTSRTYESHGPNAACAIYADDLGQPRTIGLPGDADCDGTLDGERLRPARADRRRRRRRGDLRRRLPRQRGLGSLLARRARGLDQAGVGLPRPERPGLPRC